MLLTLGSGLCLLKLVLTQACLQDNLSKHVLPYHVSIYRWGRRVTAFMDNLPKRRHTTSLVCHRYHHWGSSSPAQHNVVVQIDQCRCMLPNRGQSMIRKNQAESHQMQQMMEVPRAVRLFI